jgi:hypothetical protein
VSSLVSCLPIPQDPFVFRTNLQLCNSSLKTAVCQPTASLLELDGTLTLQLTYIAGEHGWAYCYVILVTRHVMFTVTLPRARPPYCLRRHTLLLHGCLATVVNKRHISYSMHVTLYSVDLCMSVDDRSRSRHPVYSNIQ